MNATPIPRPPAALLKRLFAGLAVAAVMLGGLEVALRSLPLDRWEQGLPGTSYPLFVRGEGAAADRYVTNPHFLGAMSRQEFPVAKRVGVRRIFVLGGSAALGWPGPEDASFAALLRRSLDQAVPGRYEVINAAAMSYGSHRVLDLLEDIVRLEPDLVVVWSGNNEYIEANSFSPLARTRAVGGLQRLLRDSSLYRTVRLGLYNVAPQLFFRPAGDDFTDLRRTPQVRRGRLGRAGAVDRDVLANYRDNLAQMARLLGEHRVDGIFCTVPVNLSSWAPANVAPSLADTAAADRWTALRQESFTFWDQQRYAEAMPLLEKLLAMAPDYALGHYLVGLGHQKAGRLREARDAFTRARDLDPRPLRALSTFAVAVRDIAAAHGMQLVDLERLFIEASGAGLSGEELFIDYVHPTVAGNKLAATALLEKILNGAEESQRQTALRLVKEDNWVERNFHWAADYDYARGMTYQNNGDFKRAEAAYLRVLQADPAMPEAAGNLGRIYEMSGDLHAARHYYEQAVRIDPGTVVGADLARVLYLLNDLPAARQVATGLLNAGLTNVDLLVLLGDIEGAAGRGEMARDYYRQAVAAGADEAQLAGRLRGRP